MLLIFPSILLLASVVTCPEVLYLHFNNVHPSRLPPGLWPLIYKEILLIVSEELSTFTKDSQGNLACWIDLLFPGAIIRPCYVIDPKNLVEPYLVDQPVDPGTLVCQNVRRGNVLVRSEGFVLSNGSFRFGENNTASNTVVWFDPTMPDYDVTKVLKFFDDCNRSRPTLIKAIPERASYHPNYRTQHPPDSSAVLPYIAGMINQAITCMEHAKPETMKNLEEQFTAVNLLFKQWLLGAFWELLVPGILVTALDGSQDNYLTHIWE